MKVYNYKEAYDHLLYTLQNKKEDAFIAIITDTVIHYGPEGGFDVTKAQLMGIPCYNLQKEGGAMVTSPGDIVYCFTTPFKNSRFNMELRNHLAKKLQARGVIVEQTKNDLLVDGKKCFGFMHRDFGGYVFYGGHISIDCDLPLIQHLCTKPMEKVPGGLSAYQITTEDVIKWLQEFWFYYKK
jgi:hypothetical protein